MFSEETRNEGERWWRMNVKVEVIVEHECIGCPFVENRGHDVIYYNPNFVRVCKKEGNRGIPFGQYMVHGTAKVGYPIPEWCPYPRVEVGL